MVNNVPESLRYRYKVGSTCRDRKNIYFMPFRSNMIISIDRQTMNMEVYHKVDKILDIYFSKILEDGSMIFSSREINNNSYFCRMDKNRSLKSIKVNYPDGYIIQRERYLDRIDTEVYETCKEYIFIESEYNSYFELMEQLLEKKVEGKMQKKSYQRLYENSDGTAGKNILNNLLNIEQ